MINVQSLSPVSPPKFNVNDTVIWQRPNRWELRQHRITLFDGYGFVTKIYWVSQDGDVPWYCQGVYSRDNAEIECRFQPQTWAYQVRGISHIDQKVHHFWIDEEYLFRASNCLIGVDWSGISRGVKLNPGYCLRPIANLPVKDLPQYRAIDLARPAGVTIESFFRTIFRQ